jgi:hypothetical protein
MFAILFMDLFKGLLFFCKLENEMNPLGINK